MIILDLFCGTKSIANAFEKRGHNVFTCVKTEIHVTKLHRYDREQERKD